jgi:transcriptional regulator with XRE-family HTH domain
MPEPTIAKVVRSHRERQELSVQELAKKAGISRQFLYAIEAGEKAPSAPVLLGIAGALGVSLATFDGCRK